MANLVTYSEGVHRNAKKGNINKDVYLLTRHAGRSPNCCSQTACPVGWGQQKPQHLCDPYSEGTPVIMPLAIELHAGLQALVVCITLCGGR